MKLYNIFFTLMILCSVGVRAQHVEKATMMRWAGGPCCIQGIEWSIQVQFPKTAKVELLKAYSQEYGEVAPALTKINDSTYIFAGDTSWNDSHNDYNINDEESLEKHKKTMPSFKGEFMWRYQINGVEKAIIVNDFETIPGPAYP